MFYRFFAKETHPDLDKAMRALLPDLALDPKKWTIKQQMGTYQHAYSYVAQGHGLTISFYEEALKEKKRCRKTELMVACKNAPWLSLLACAPQQRPPSKRRLDIQALPDNPAWQPWQLQTNNSILAEHLLTQVYQELEIFQALDAVELVLERQRLYVKWLWLPDTPARQAQLKATINFARALTNALDQVATVTSE
ncbi:MAG: hypothetical protein ACRBFS_03035 [Aureispira sp.]